MGEFEFEYTFEPDAGSDSVLTPNERWMIEACAVPKIYSLTPYVGPPQNHYYWGAGDVDDEERPDGYIDEDDEEVYLPEYSRASAPAERKHLGGCLELTSRSPLLLAFFKLWAKVTGDSETPGWVLDENDPSENYFPLLGMWLTPEGFNASIAPLVIKTLDGSEFAVQNWASQLALDDLNAVVAAQHPSLGPANGFTLHFPSDAHADDADADDADADDEDAMVGFDDDRCKKLLGLERPLSAILSWNMNDTTEGNDAAM